MVKCSKIKNIGLYPETCIGKKEKMGLREDTDKIIKQALEEALPGNAVKRALKELHKGTGRLIVIAIGKAAWQMAKAACDERKGEIDSGIVITKYGHSKGELSPLRIFEAGHPVPDENGFRATGEAMKLVEGLSSEDTILFLVSGGGSALFEQPLIPGDEMADITRQMLASGADIVEMNTIRKRLSAVKGGKFAALAYPAKIFSVILSDVIGDPLDMIASGPAYPDSSTCEQAKNIAEKYKLRLSAEAAKCLATELPRELTNVESHVTGSVRQLCASAKKTAESIGYETCILSDSLCCRAADAGSFLASIARFHVSDGKKLAFIAGGETVVHLTGHGMGGRNQEIALSAAQGIAGLDNAAVFSIGSDGTDGPTDAAGGYCDGTTKACLEEQGISIPMVLSDNDAYHALEKCKGLIITGPTGTNVNDLSVLLIN